VKSTNINF